MTELDLATTISATPLAEYLAAAEAGPAFETRPYLGVLTPQHLDAPEVELTSFFEGAAVHDLGWLRRIAVRGEDRTRWLSGMVTNAVEALADKTGAYNLVLNAQGRIQGDAYVWRDGDFLELEVTAQQETPLLEHLDRFIVMDDVELVAVEGESALGLTGPLTAELLLKLGVSAPIEPLSSARETIAGFDVRIFSGYGKSVPHFVLWVATDRIPDLWRVIRAAGAKPVGAAAVETLRVVEGIPAYGIDILSRDLAQETAQDRALSFTKGCYLGQEIVERIRSRGQVHRHLRSLELTPDSPGLLPALGSELRISGAPDDSKSVGTITSVTEAKLGGSLRAFAIGMIRAEAEVGKQTLVYPGGSARILKEVPKLNAA